MPKASPRKSPRKSVRKSPSKSPHAGVFRFKNGRTAHCGDVVTLANGAKVEVYKRKTKEGKTYLSVKFVKKTTRASPKK